MENAHTSSPGQSGSLSVLGRLAATARAMIGSARPAEQEHAALPEATAQQPRVAERWERVGYDFARYGVVPRGSQRRNAGFMDGYDKGLRECGVRPGTAATFVRVWMEHRAHAAAANLPFSHHLTPEYIRDIYPQVCPITRERLAPAGLGARLSLIWRDLGYAPGNVVVTGDRAHHAMSTVRLRHDILAIHRRLEAGPPDAVHMTLNPAEWLRIATLVSFSHVPMSEDSVAEWPVAVTPPAGAAILSSAWAFKVACADAALRGDEESAQRMCDEQALPDFNSFARTLRGAAGLASSLLPADIPPEWTARHAAEDAWADPQVTQRWQEFIAAQRRSAQVISPVPAVTGALIAHRVRVSDGGRPN